MIHTTSAARGTGVQSSSSGSRNGKRSVQDSGRRIAADYFTNEKSEAAPDERWLTRRYSPDPGDADEPFVHLNFHHIAGGHAIEIAAAHRNALEAVPVAPGSDHEAPILHRPRHRKFADDACLF